MSWPLFSDPNPPDVRGDGLRKTGLLDAAGRPIFFKRPCGFIPNPQYVVFQGDHHD